MTDILAVVLLLTILVLLYGLLFVWAFRILPREGWQVLAVIPTRQRHDGTWDALNLTYYGAWTATAVTIAVAVAVFLLGSIGIPFARTLEVTVALLILCVPAAKWMARIIEGKPNTFTIGGTSFVGILLMPWLLMGIEALRQSGNSAGALVLPTLAAATVAYAFGEGTGRLACISFGCCYGKPVAQLPPAIARLFTRYCFVFRGSTKKIAYEAGWEAVPVVPIQALTAILYVGLGILGVGIYLTGHYVAAFLLSWVGTQLWRAVSELVRGDNRGTGSISTYQIFALVGTVYGAGVALVFAQHQGMAPTVAAGLSTLFAWPPLMMLQLVWLGIFLFLGRSKVTASSLSMHVVRDQI